MELTITLSENILRTECTRILTEMIAAGHDVVESCASWDYDELEDFYDNYIDHYPSR